MGNYVLLFFVLLFGLPLTCLAEHQHATEMDDSENVASNDGGKFDPERASQGNQLNLVKALGLPPGDEGNKVLGQIAHGDKTVISGILQNKNLTEKKKSDLFESLQKMQSSGTFMFEDQKALLKYMEEDFKQNLKNWVFLHSDYLVELRNGKFPAVLSHLNQALEEVKALKERYPNEPSLQLLYSDYINYRDSKFPLPRPEPSSKAQRQSDLNQIGDWLKNGRTESRPSNQTVVANPDFPTKSNSFLPVSFGRQTSTSNTGAVTSTEDPNWIDQDSTTPSSSMGEPPNPLSNQSVLRGTATDRLLRAIESGNPNK